MRTEYDALMENNTWTLVSRPINDKVLKSKWVFRIKTNQDGSIEKHKARLVARGDQQIEGIHYDEVFAPVARLETIRTLLASSVARKMHVHQLDVVTAYVQGDLNDDVYMEQPEMFEKPGQRDKVCKLSKPLYGLKQAGREWYRKLDNYLVNLGFKNTEINPCVYVDCRANHDTVIVVYVDDLLIASKSLTNISTIKRKLSRQFKMKDLGNVREILGMEVERQGELGDVTIVQKGYIRDMLSRFGMSDCKPIGTPLEQNIDIAAIESENENEVVDVPYRELVGSLIYLGNASRPDIAFAANFLSRFCNNPNLIYWKMAKRVLRYLKGTIDYKIRYSAEDDCLTAYVDSDWAGDTSDRRSNTGYVAVLAGGPISWSSRKQRTVALSTMEAEYMALSDATKEIVYIRDLLKHIRHESILSEPTVIYCDNQSAIKLSKNSVFHSRSKHIDIRYHFSREAQERGDIIVKYVPTDEMSADVLTKSIPKNKHENCINLLRLCN